MDIPAGFKDGEVEFFTINSESSFLINGEKFSYHTAPNAVKTIFYEEYARDIREVPERLMILKSIAKDEEFETWMNCNFGGFNSTPDVDLRTGRISREFWNCGLKECCSGYGIICHNKFNLTRAEYHIFKSYKDGIPDKIISDRMHISQHTLRNHNASILRKLEAHSKIEALKKAEKEGVII